MKHYFQPTPQQIAKVKDWLYDGLSLTQIGSMLGVTRNVVSGVIWRRPSLKAIQKQRFNGTIHYHRPAPAKIITKCLEQPVPDMQPPAKDDEPAAPPPPAGVLLKDLGINQCKYPVAFDKDAVGYWLFCGHPTRSDQNYCPKHLKRIRQGGTT